MRSTATIISLTVFVAAFLTPAQDAHANVYASQLKITNPDTTEFDGNFSDGTGALLSFFLNDTASVVTVSVIDVASGNSVAEINAGSMSAGLHGVEWDGSGGEAGNRYIFEVFAEQPNRSNTEWTVFFDSGDIDIFSRGCDVVRDMGSSLFGLVYAPNTGGAPPQEGKGITIYNPDGSFHDPFLVAADIADGGTVDWGSGTQSMFAGVFDDEERFYVSAINFGEVRRLNKDFSLTTVVSGLTNPKGLDIVGTGADRVLYICDDSRVVRAAIGNEDVFSGTLEVVGEFSNGLPRNIAVDDSGAIYVSFRATNALDSDPVALNKYDLSLHALPVSDADASWFLDAATTLRVADLEIDHGADLNSSTDDILYYSTRAGDGTFDDGVWRVEDINTIFPIVVNLIDEMDLYGFDDGANINDRAAIALDAAGNIVLMENSNEHVFFLSPPGQGDTNSYTTTGNDTITVEVDVSVETTGEIVPTGYSLAANYPNPFNPSTTINYVLGGTGETTLKVYNLLGGEIRTLVNEVQAAGEYSVTWDGKENTGSNVASGVYILHLKSGDFSQSRRITLMK